jgi:hypothetical protein
MSGFVLLNDFGLDTTPRIHLDAILNRPHPHRSSIRPTLRGLRPGRRTPTTPGYPASSVGKTAQGTTQFVRVTFVQINHVFTAVEGERYRFASFGAINIIFQNYDCLFCHKTRLTAAERTDAPLEQAIIGLIEGANQDDR